MRSWLQLRLQLTPQRLLSVRLAIIALVVMLLVQAGSLGSADTTTRLQATHSWWTNSPSADPQEIYNLHYTVRGRNQQPQVTFGAGQSLVMLPADIAATTIIQQIPTLAQIDTRTHGKLRIALIAYTLAALVTVLPVLLSFHFLQLLGFSPRQAIAGALSLLLATSFLHYIQVLQENNLLLLLTLAAYYGQYYWFVNLPKSRWALAGGFAASGFNLLVRLTTLLDTLAVVLFIGGLFGISSTTAKDNNRRNLRFQEYLFTGTVIGTLFVLLERSYHYYRFGTFTDTYLHIAAVQYRQIAPYLPASYPFQLPFSTGFWGALFSPEKSIFLFDPLLLLTLLLLWRQRRKLSSPIILFAATQLLLLGGYICFYARYFCWGGDAAWADRFVTTPVQLLAMLALPLLFKYKENNKITALGCLLTFLSLLIQLLSVTLSYNLEVLQETLGRTAFRIALRADNVLQILQGKTLANYQIIEPLAKLQFLPFQLQEYFPALFPWALWGWWLIVLLLLAMILRLIQSLRQEIFDPDLTSIQ
jgi:hypothetical protein